MTDDRSCLRWFRDLDEDVVYRVIVIEHHVIEPNGGENDDAADHG